MELKVWDSDLALTLTSCVTLAESPAVSSKDPQPTDLDK